MSSRHLFLQLSDIHLLADPSRRLRSGDPLHNLEAAAELIVSSPSRPEAMILTGDLTDSGHSQAYAMLGERIAALAAAIGSDVVYLPGNHDDREGVRRLILEQNRGETTERSSTTGCGAIRQVRWYGDLRLVALDTLVPGSDAGALEGGDLEWLAAELAAEQAPGGTILALHHPPIPSPIEPMTEIALAQPELLEGVIDGSDVCLVICGHYHHATAGLLGSVPVFAAPALSYRADPLVETQFVGTRGSAFARIDLIDRRPLVTVVPVMSSGG